jgi:hypothetical protein
MPFSDYDINLKNVFNIKRNETFYENYINIESEMSIHNKTTTAYPISSIY